MQYQMVIKQNIIEIGKKKNRVNLDKDNNKVDTYILGFHYRDASQVILYLVFLGIIMQKINRCRIYVDIMTVEKLTSI